MNSAGTAGVHAGSSNPAGEDAGAPRGWYSRGYLPHRDTPHLVQFVTYRLADSLPQVVLAQFEKELAELGSDRREVLKRKRMEATLDTGMGCCALRHPEVARYVQDSLMRFQGERYLLHAWCIMPNHVHVLVESVGALASVVQGWKSYTARWALRQNQQFQLGIPEKNRFWMREYWDRYMRDEGHYQATVAYIQNNPVKAGLCCTPEEWPWSSAFRENDLLLCRMADDRGTVLNQHAGANAQRSQAQKPAGVDVKRIQAEENAGVDLKRVQAEENAGVDLKRVQAEENAGEDAGAPGERE